MSGWGVAGSLLLVAGAAVLLLWANLRSALMDLAELEQRLMQEAVRASTWQRRFEFADEEIGRLQAELAATAPFDTLTTAPAFSADDMAFLLREASRLG
ncbi:MAG: hypothetical protein KAX65_14225 [Caldilineaceae bacterium]|nr:hypothetical protein [Caldilineaceae bacterium]